MSAEPRSDGIGWPHRDIEPHGWLWFLLITLILFGVAACSQQDVATLPDAPHILDSDLAGEEGIGDKAGMGDEGSLEPQITLEPEGLVTSGNSREQPPAPIPTPIPCHRGTCVYTGHFYLARPISPPGRDTVDPTYRYGGTQEGQRETHHGVELVNSHGTSVVAAASGMVKVAGDDQNAVYAAWPGFYGNLVVIEHDLLTLESGGDSTQPGWQASPHPVIYTLYAHLSEVNVEVGQFVQVGDVIGLVGLSGTAIGSHLHFEVRFGENSYTSTRNPELWLKPHLDEVGQPHGALAGRVLDEYGEAIYLPNIVVERMAEDGETPLATYYLEGYADASVNGDDLWGENFALGDLPAGKYRVSFVARGLREYNLEVHPGQVTLIVFEAGKTTGEE